MKIDFEGHLRKAERSLADQLKYIRSIQFPKHLRLENLQISDDVFMRGAEEIQAKFNLPKRECQVLYIMRIERHNLDKIQLENIVLEIKKIKESQKTYKTRITCINQKNVEHHLRSNQDIVIYVGSSKVFAQRLKEHVGFGSKDTATTLLKRWPPLIDGRIGLTIDYFDFGPQIMPESVKLIEFELSRELKPLMGRNRRA